MHPSFSDSAILRRASRSVYRGSTVGSFASYHSSDANRSSADSASVAHAPAAEPLLDTEPHSALALHGRFY